MMREQNDLLEEAQRTLDPSRHQGSKNFGVSQYVRKIR